MASSFEAKKVEEYITSSLNIPRDTALSDDEKANILSVTSHVVADSKQRSMETSVALEKWLEAQRRNHLTERLRLVILGAI